MAFNVTKCEKKDERDISTPLTLDTLKTVSEQFTADLETLGLTEHKISSQYICRHILAFDGMGEEYPMCTIRSEQKGTQWITALKTITDFLCSDADSKTALHTGDSEDAEAAVDDLQDGFRITHYAKRGTDKFYLDFTPKKSVVRNYALDATRDAVETWADNQEVLA